MVVRSTTAWVVRVWLVVWFHRALIDRIGVSAFVASSWQTASSPQKMRIVLKEANSDNEEANTNPLDNDDSDFATLAQRIAELQEKEANKEKSMAVGLSNRVSELSRSEEMSHWIQSQSLVDLPVISFDALLPGQRLEGRTEDETFSRFLRDTGLGGWFVMVSLSPRARKLRRHGVIAKIEFVDAIAGASSYQSKDILPTAIDFCIVGYRRCRVVGPRTKMKQRVGRWRRGYDPEGEESLLGWGTEVFLDAADEVQIIEVDSNTRKEELEQHATRDFQEWTSCQVECNLDEVDAEADIKAMENTTIHDHFHSLIPKVEEWYELASNSKTFDNVNVTASTRIQRGQPGLYVDPKALLHQVRKSLGPRPDNPTEFCFWAAALINPLPVLGASLEIRGQMLEAPTVERRLCILEWGLARSMDNLTGKRPL